MTNQEAITQITSMIGQAQNQVDALTIALGLLQTGYQSDKVAINTAIAAGITAAIAPLQSALDTVNKPQQAQPAQI